MSEDNTNSYREFLNFAIHDTGEFFRISDLDSSLIKSLCYDGFLPMDNYYIFDDRQPLDIKLHHQRCLIKPQLVKIGKTVRKRAGNYKLIINKDFDLTMKYVWEQHGYSWFSPRLYDLIMPFISINASKELSFNSVELWRDEELAAGDIGMVSGSRYLSMTGFYRMNGAGTVLLESIRRLLFESGFEMWDMGMEMDYKMKMGGFLVNRDVFLESVRSAREKFTDFCTYSIGCGDLLSK